MTNNERIEANMLIRMYDSTEAEFQSVKVQIKRYKKKHGHYPQDTPELLINIRERLQSILRAIDHLNARIKLFEGVEIPDALPEELL